MQLLLIIDTNPHVLSVMQHPPSVNPPMVSDMQLGSGTPPPPSGRVPPPSKVVGSKHMPP
jgi:hypothetical protein